LFDRRVGRCQPADFKKGQPTKEPLQTTAYQVNSKQEGQCTGSLRTLLHFPGLNGVISSHAPFHQTKATGKRYLVVGGSGFLGSHIVEALLARGEEHIRIFDQHNTPLFQNHRFVEFMVVRCWFLYCTIFSTKRQRQIIYLPNTTNIGQHCEPG